MARKAKPEGAQLRHADAELLAQRIIDRLALDRQLLRKFTTLDQAHAHDQEPFEGSDWHWVRLMAHEAMGRVQELTWLLGQDSPSQRNRRELQRELIQAELAVKASRRAEAREQRRRSLEAKPAPQRASKGASK